MIEFWGPIFEESNDEFMTLSYDKVMITNLVS